jgi:hypothetical protein
MPHPRQNELILLKKAIKAVPFTFPKEEKEKMFNRLNEFEKNPNAPAKDIEAAIVEVGKETWAHRKAYHDMLDSYAADKMNDFFKKNIRNGLLDKFEKFEKKGGGLKDLRRGKEFEEMFTAEENLQIEQAIFSAREELGRHMEDVIKEHREEYDQAVETYEKRKKDLANMIASLAELADKSEKWSPEILDKVRRFEQGWSAVEQDFDEDKLKHEIEYWEGVIGLD